MGKTRQSQLNNFTTFSMYIRQFKELAQNVFIFKNMPSNIDIDFLNKKLVRAGAVAFFIDDVMNELLALPFNIVGNLDNQNRPTTIEVFSGNTGYHQKLKPKEYVIMWDNTSHYPIYLDVLEYAERYAISTRSSDINVLQQRTPRIWKCAQGQEATLKRILATVDSMADSVMAYDNLDIEGISCVLEPAPYVADKLEDNKRAIKAEFLERIGISHIQYNKRERMITDEVIDSQGATVASRFSRFTPRYEAIKLINEKFKDYLEKPIEVYYYDNVPSSEDEKKKEDNQIEETEGVKSDV